MNNPGERLSTPYCKPKAVFQGSSSFPDMSFVSSHRFDNNSQAAALPLNSAFEWLIRSISVPLRLGTSVMPRPTGIGVSSGLGPGRGDGRDGPRPRAFPAADRDNTGWIPRSAHSTRSSVGCHLISSRSSKPVTHPGFQRDPAALPAPIGRHCRLGSAAGRRPAASELDRSPRDIDAILQPRLQKPATLRPGRPNRRP